MSEAEGSAAEEPSDSDRLSALQRRAEQIERRLKEELGKAWVSERYGTDKGETTKPEKPGAPTEADEEPTGVGLEAVKLRQGQLKLDQREQDMKLRERLATNATRLVIAQVAVANILFAFYLGHNAYDADASVMIAWLSATVVEVVGILWVIARNLFPYRDKSAPVGGRDFRGTNR